MRTTQQFSITLPMDMAEVVEKKIKSGMYASASEVMRDSLWVPTIPDCYLAGVPRARLLSSAQHRATAAYLDMDRLLF
jgi:hypothetical protein